MYSTEDNFYCNITILVQCLDGDIRLSEGDTEREGRLEVCLNQRWGTVSRSGWIVANIQVVCNQLGYPGGGVQ